MRVLIGSVALAAMMALTSLTPAAGFAGGRLNTVDRERLYRPHVETYWESWAEGTANYAAELIDVPISRPGTGDIGANVVNIAFATSNDTSDTGCYLEDNCITKGLIMDPAKLHAAVGSIHDRGGLVKLAVGGALNGNLGAIGSKPMTELEQHQFVQRLVRVVDTYNLDGIDLTQAGKGMYIPSVQVQTAIVKLLREELAAQKIISYTFPNEAPSFENVLLSIHPYLDYIMPFDQWYAYPPEDYTAMGIPSDHIVLGTMIAAQYDGRPCDSIQDTLARGNLVLNLRLGGVMTWSINSDTEQRDDFESGECNPFQTGKPNGTFISLYSSIINTA